VDRLLRQKKNQSGTVWMGLFPGSEEQKGGQLSQLSIGYLFSFIQQTV
jgi:hypothetical protein